MLYFEAESDSVVVSALTMWRVPCLFVLSQMIMLLAFVTTGFLALVPTEFHPGFTGPPSDLSNWKLLLSLVDLAPSGPSLTSKSLRDWIKGFQPPPPQGPNWCPLFTALETPLMPPGR